MVSVRVTGYVLPGTGTTRSFLVAVKSWIFGNLEVLIGRRKTALSLRE